MLLYYHVQNYRSFRELLLLASSCASIENENEGGYEIDIDLEGYDKDLNEVNIILGMNNSGKTNFIDSIKDFKALMNGRIEPKDLLSSVADFGSNGIIEYALVFEMAGSIYQYEIVIDPKNDSVVSELFVSSTGVIIDTVDGIRFIQGSGCEYTMAHNGIIANWDVRKLASEYNAMNNTKWRTFLGDSFDVFVKLMDEHSSSFSDLDLFLDSLSIIGTEELMMFDSKQISSFLELSDTGIESIELKVVDSADSEYVELSRILDQDVYKRIDYVYEQLEHCVVKLDDNYYLVDEMDDLSSISRVVFVHDDGMRYSPSEESEGIRRLFELSEIITSNKKGAIFIVDELDRKLHTNLSKAIVDCFVNKRLGQQLIYTTHDTAFLSDSVLSRNRKWVIEKECGISKLYNLGCTHLSDDILSDYVSGRSLMLR